MTWLPKLRFVYNTKHTFSSKTDIFQHTPLDMSSYSYAISIFTIPIFFMFSLISLYALSFVSMSAGCCSVRMCVGLTSFIMMPSSVKFLRIMICLFLAQDPILSESHIAESLSIYSFVGVFISWPKSFSIFLIHFAYVVASQRASCSDSVDDKVIIFIFDDLAPTYPDPKVAMIPICPLPSS